jgi:CheY-like chemotaxis protein/anti-sigma regulatory factor (Ser/Thr protein kinase)
MNANPRAAKRILLADDDEALRRMLQGALDSAGYAVTCAGDGAQALALLDAQPFDLILIDVWMPRMTGLEVLARLKDGPSSPKAIIMTGDHTPDTVLRAVREQAYQYIPKPFAPSAVVEMVDKALAAAATAPPIEVLSASPDWVELSVPCDRAAAERVQDFLMHLKADLPEDVRDAVGQAFRELLLNAMEWGGGLDPSRRVRIAFLRGKRVLLYRIADPGKGFRMEDMSHAAIANPPDDPIGHFAERERRGLRAGGFGILLAREIADELIYNEARNEVVFMKYLE